MKTAAKGREWLATAMSCVIACALLLQPSMLPTPLQGGVEGAVDGVARVCLRVWGEPINPLDFMQEPRPDGWVVFPVRAERDPGLAPGSGGGPSVSVPADSERFRKI